MKIFIYILIAFAIGLLIFNLTQVDFAAPFEGTSKIALISVLACACAVILLIILQISRKIAGKK